MSNPPAIFLEKRNEKRENRGGEQNRPGKERAVTGVSF
jgi:hypothetical protein